MLFTKQIINLLFLLSIICWNAGNIFAQTKTIQEDTLAQDTLSKFDKFNKKAEALFIVLPFPMVSYTTETGTVFGLAKYNLVRLVKGDTVSAASSFSELVSISKEGQFKVVLGSSLYLNQNKIILKGGVNYIEYPEYILGVGNDVSRENIERIKTKRIAFDNAFLMSANKSNTLYFGVFQEYKNYMSVEKDTNSFLVVNQYPGYKGGITSGFGVGFIFDTRNHKYNAKEGLYVITNFKFFDGSIGSDFNYNSFEFDIRKYFNPWLEHVIALQAYTQANYGTVPFYSLGMIGGSIRMRGYYLGAIRDKVIADAQVEYRMPVWKIFGVTAFASAGRVAEKYSLMNFNGLWYAGGFGLRIMVDSKNKANLRIDFGFGQIGERTVVIGFTEAF